ncbi:MAG: hypothetical protein JOZ13_13835 [Alphaproteobacteria bacterium]|nr:hypothetical protein [Alphaproteobacteria bacterium]
MAYSLCILGSSHAGAIKQAWSSRAAASSPSLTFFAKGGAKMRQLAYRNGIIAHPSPEVRLAFQRTSGGEEKIVLARYDAVVFYAIGLSFDKVLELGKEFATVKHLRYGGEGALVSSACFAAMLRATIAESAALSLLAKMRKDYKGPVVVCPTPLPPESLFMEQLPSMPARFADACYLATLYREMSDAMSAACTELGAALVGQGDDTIAPPCFTRSEFALGAPMNKRGMREEYNKHMNQAFGALMLDAILAKLEALSGGKLPCPAASDAA